MSFAAYESQPERFGCAASNRAGAARRLGGKCGALVVVLVGVVVTDAP